MLGLLLSSLWDDRRMFRSISLFSVLFSTGLALTLQGMFLLASAQSTPPVEPTLPAQSKQQPERSEVKQQPNRKFKLKIEEGDVIGVSLKADKVRLSEVAAEFSKRLKVPVILGPSLEKESVTMEFTDFTLETALQLLAPCVYMDYEIRSGTPAKRLGILLFGRNDPKPAANAVVQASSQGFLIEGNTEDTGTDSKFEDDDVLQVELDRNYLTVKSKKQPLTVVVLTVADVLGVPAEIKYDSDEIVNTEIKNILFEDAIPKISPNIRLYVRDDLSRFERTALKVSIVPPTRKDEAQ
jgi:hypothetical protein